MRTNLMSRHHTPRRQRRETVFFAVGEEAGDAEVESVVFGGAGGGGGELEEPAVGLGAEEESGADLAGGGFEDVVGSSPVPRARVAPPWSSEAWVPM